MKYSAKVDDNQIRISYPLFHDVSDTTPTNAKQLHIRPVNVRQAQRLNEAWHSVLPKTYLGNLVGNTRNICFEAVFDELAYAVAIWTTPIAANRMKNGSNKLELRRLAISDDAPKNTASRMLRLMRKLIFSKWPELISLVSYQADKHHTGTIYRAAGWKITGTSKAAEWHKDENRAALQTQSTKTRWEYYQHEVQRKS